MPDLEAGDSHLITINKRTRKFIPYEYTWAPLQLTLRASAPINVILVRNHDADKINSKNAIALGAMVYPQTSSLNLHIRQLPGSWSLDTGWKLIFENLSQVPIAVDYSLKMVWYE